MRFLAAVLAVVVLLQGAAVSAPLACDSACAEKGFAGRAGQADGDAPDQGCKSCLCCSAARHPGMIFIAELPGPAVVTTVVALAPSLRFFQPGSDILHVPRPSRA